MSLPFSDIKLNTKVLKGLHEGTQRIFRHLNLCKSLFQICQQIIYVFNTNR
jgi:hypothetical protein